MNVTIDHRHLSNADLRWLIETTGRDDLTAAQLRSEARRLVGLSEHPAAAAALMHSRDDWVPTVGPFLFFLVLIGHALRSMEDHPSLAEPMAAGKAVPVFDAAELRRFAGDPPRRLFLVDLLASFAHVESGVQWIRTDTGWHRRHWSELDPLSLAQRAVDATGAERAAALRRLGDLALFLGGVFPEHVRARPIEPRILDRIHRLLAAVSSRAVPGPGELLLAGGEVRGIWLLEWLGRLAYTLAIEMPETRDAALLTEVAHGFRAARRTLNAVAVNTLGELRHRWFAFRDG